MSKKYGIQTKGTGRAVMQGGGAARADMRSGYYPSDMGMRGGPMYNKGGRVGLRDRAFAKGGRVGLKEGSVPKGFRGEKGILQKIKEGISRKIRGKEKTEHKGLEQDKKTGYYTHKAPEDRLDTAPGRKYKADVMRWSHRMPLPKRPKSNDMSYKERKKEIKREKKEAKRKDDFDKKHKVGKYKEKKEEKKQPKKGKQHHA